MRRVGGALFFVLTWASLQDTVICCAGNAGRRGACIEVPGRRAGWGCLGVERGWQQWSGRDEGLFGRRGRMVNGAGALVSVSLVAGGEEVG